MIYLDNAATTLHKPPQVIQAVVDALNGVGNSARGTHSASLNASRIVYETREKLARLMNCCSGADHVVFTANVTEALNIAINGLIQTGDHVITTELEHNSVLRPLYRLQDEKNVGLSFVPTDACGNPDYDCLERLLQDNTRAVICTHASNLTGNLVDLEIMGRFARKHDLLFIVDAAQTAGSLPIDMERFGISVLCFTGHKGLMGPQGTGGLCVQRGIDIHPLVVGGTGVQSHSRTQPCRLPNALEAGTLNVHGIAGLSAALDYINTVGIAEIHAKEMMLTRRFFDGVSTLPNVKVYGDYRWDRAAIVALNIGDRDSGEIADTLCEKYDIAVRSGAHCAPKMHDVLGTFHQGAVRFSFSWFNTVEEIDVAVQAVAELAAE